MKYLLSSTHLPVVGTATACSLIHPENRAAVILEAGSEEFPRAPGHPVCHDDDRAWKYNAVVGVTLRFSCVLESVRKRRAGVERPLDPLTPFMQSLRGRP